jgi:hypothetical protein
VGKRGPKPVVINQLRVTALVWAHFLYTLRDGQAGSIRKLKLGPWRTTAPLAVLRWDEVGRPESVEQRIRAGKMRYETLRFGETLIERDIVVRSTRKALREAELLVKGKTDWRLEPPILPKPKIWERLTKTRSVSDIRQIARGLRKSDPVFASVLRSHAKTVLEAKQLPNYPGSDRKHSDDKRIWFFAKVLAGLELGIAPATATKRLAHFVPRLTKN